MKPFARAQVLWTKHSLLPDEPSLPSLILVQILSASNLCLKTETISMDLVFCYKPCRCQTVHATVKPR